MPDQPRKPLATLHPDVPEEVRKFVRCRRDSVDIAPQTLDLPNLPAYTLSFEDAGNGSITIQLDGPGDFLDVSIPVSIQDGHLVADTSGIPFGREFVDKWIKDFNADLDAPPAKQLSGVSISNGKLHVTKSKVASGAETTVIPVVPPPMIPQEPSHHAGNPIPEPVVVVAPDTSADMPPPPPPPDHVVNPIPPPVKVESEEVVTTTDSVPDLNDLGTDAESGFIERPPISEEASRFAAFKGKVVTSGVVGLGVIAFFLFNNLGGDSQVVAPDPPVEAAVDLESEPATQGQSSEEPAAEEEPAADEEPVSNSVHVTDPAGDNGRGGTGADILGLEYVQDGDVFTVLLTMGFSPLEASVLWYSYYMEVTLVTFLENFHVLIWENHAGESRSGELDSSGNANGVGVTLTNEFAEFLKTLAPGDRVVEIRVVAFSLVEQEDQVTEDRMSVEVSAS